MAPAASPRTAAALVLAAASLAATAGAPGPYMNARSGEPLRAGVYGRVEVRGPTPPPVIYSLPVVADGPRIALKASTEPLYLYVPPGQVRRWPQSCALWKACDQPVLFVRVDESPSRWGRWRHLRDQVATSAGVRD